MVASTEHVHGVHADARGLYIGNAALTGATTADHTRIQVVHEELDGIVKHGIGTTCDAATTFGTVQVYIMHAEAVGQIEVDGPRDGVMSHAATTTADTVQTGIIHGRSEDGKEKRKAKKAKLQKARRANSKESQRQMNEEEVPLDAEDTDVTGKWMNPYGLVRGLKQLYPDAESRTISPHTLLFILMEFIFTTVKIISGGDHQFQYSIRRHCCFQNRRCSYQYRHHHHQYCRPRLEMLPIHSTYGDGFACRWPTSRS